MTALWQQSAFEVLAPKEPQSPAQSWVQVLTNLDAKYGGLSSAVPALARELEESRLVETSIAAFCAKDEEILPEGFLPSQLSYWPISRTTWLLDTLRERKLHEELKALFSDSNGVHIHGLWEQSTFAAASVARSLNLPYVLSAHGMLEPWALANKQVKKLIYTRMIEQKNVADASCLHALTRAEADQYIRFGAKSPIAVIPNGVNIPESMHPGMFVDQYPQLTGKRLVLYLGRLHPKKGPDLLLEAWASVSGAFPDAHLVLAGPDTEGTLDRLQAFVSAQGLHQRVLFTGMLSCEMKWSALSAAEVFVLPSQSEGLSIAALEALSAGLPVILTTNCNMPEVTRSKAGWEIEPTLQDLTSALQDVLANSPEINGEIGRRGAELARSRYTWASVARHMAEVYQWLSGGAAPQQVEMIFPGRSS